MDKQFCHVLELYPWTLNQAQIQVTGYWMDVEVKRFQEPNPTTNQPFSHQLEAVDWNLVLCPLSQANVMSSSGF